MLEAKDSPEGFEVHRSELGMVLCADDPHNITHPYVRVGITSDLSMRTLGAARSFYSTALGRRVCSMPARVGPVDGFHCKASILGGYRRLGIGTALSV